MSEILLHENQSADFPTRSELALIDSHKVVFVFVRERRAPIHYRRRLSRSRIYRQPSGHIREVGGPRVLLRAE